MPTIGYAYPAYKFSRSRRSAGHSSKVGSSKWTSTAVQMAHGANSNAPSTASRHHRTRRIHGFCGNFPGSVNSKSCMKNQPKLTSINGRSNAVTIIGGKIWKVLPT